VFVDRLESWLSGGGLDQAILGGIQRGMTFARGLAATDMQGHGGKPRKGGTGERLWHTIRVIEPERSGRGYRSGLRAGSPGVRYARIQEFGGVIQHPGSSGKLQVFETRAGDTVFTMKTKPHSIAIPGLHYLWRALQQALPVVRHEISREGVAVSFREEVL